MERREPQGRPATDGWGRAHAAPDASLTHRGGEGQVLQPLFDGGTPEEGHRCVQAVRALASLARVRELIARMARHRVTLVRSMPAHSSRDADSFGVVIVLAFLGGCWSLVVGAMDAGFADDVGRAVGRAWPSVLATLVLWAIAAAAELGAHLRESRETLPITALLARSVAVAVVGVVSLAIATGVVELVGMTDGFLGLATVLVGWVRVSAGPVGRLLRPSATTPRPPR